MKKSFTYYLKKIFVSVFGREMALKVRRKFYGIYHWITLKGLKKEQKKLEKQYSYVILEDTDFEYIDLKEQTKDKPFAFDVLGIIGDLKKCDTAQYSMDLGEILKDDDICIRISYLDDYSETEQSEIENFKNNAEITFLSEGKSLIVDTDAKKVAFISAKLSRNGDVNNIQVEEQLLKNIMYAQKAKVDYIAVYAVREKHSKVELTSYERKYLNKLANIGCEMIICSNEYGIDLGSNIKRKGDNYVVSSTASIGALLSNEENNNAAAVLRFKLVDIEDEHHGIALNKGYIPVFNVINDERITGAVRIDYHNHEHKRNHDMMETLTYIENKTGNIRDIRNVLCIKDICSILDVELPEKYSYLKDVSVGKVCSRSFEVNGGDVFFFRQPFNDVNDKEPEPLELRMRVVDKAMRRGARFIFSYVDLGKDIPHVVLENAREAHITVSAALRNLYEIKTIGITGSVGKTSTKDMLYNVLKQKYVTERNQRNSNTQVNIGLHVQDFRGAQEFFIQEIGGGRPGGASRHSRMILPEATIVTNIGHAHIGNYGTQEKLMESKLGIMDGMNKNGTLYLNGDDPLLRTAKVPVDTVFYGVENKEADYYADDINENVDHTTFTIVDGEERIPALINVLGKYNVLNAVCCYAIGKKFGLTKEQIVQGLSEFETTGIRQNLIRVAGYDLFVDCFNSSPASINSSLSVLDQMETEGRKIAVIGDVTGLAELSEQIHVEIGDIIKKHNMDELICFGEESKITYNVVKDTIKNVRSMTSEEELLRYLENEVDKKDIVLFKASSKMKLTEIIDTWLGTRLSDQGHIDEAKYQKLSTGGVRYYVFAEYASLFKASDNLESIKIPSSISGRKVYSIGEGAFSENENLSRVVVSKGVRNIDDEVFKGCSSLREVKLPDTIKYIGQSAFEGCDALTKITIGNGVMHISENAFKGCSSLKKIVLPSSVLQIEDGAFDECDELVIKCERNSFAEQYCQENNIQYVV